jgi:hypothetical protein
MDEVNDRWVEFVVIHALMMGIENIILDRFSFGCVKDLEEIYQ